MEAMSKSGITKQRLIAYAAGELPEPQAAEVEAFLARDPEAARTVALCRMAQAAIGGDDGVDPPPEVVARAKAVFEPQPHGPGPVEAVVRTIARLIFDSRAQPAYAGLRGAATAFQMTYELSGVPACPGAELDLQAQLTDGEDEGRPWRLLGQVASPQLIGSLRVDVCRAGSLAPIQTVEGDRRGGFVVLLPPGTYDLHLRLAGGVSVVPDIRIP